MATNFFRNILLLLLIVCAASCRSYKDAAYFQDASLTENYPLIDSLRTLRVMPKDVLHFSVAGLSVPEAAAKYNLTMTRKREGNAEGTMLSQNRGLVGYMVENDGCINFPVVGKMQVVGKTLAEVERDVAHAIAHDFTEQPVVTARIENYRVTVIGESRQQGVIELSQQYSVNILEALAAKGDLTVYGMRNNITVVREGIDGEKTFYRVDLRSKDFINNPGYYLKQNDVVYIEPNETRKRDVMTGQSTNLIVSLVSIGLSVGSLLLRLF